MNQLNSLILDRSINESQITQSIYTSNIFQEEKRSERRKLIDFEERRKEFEKITEETMSFAGQVVEDVIFLGERKAISLEYIFYQGQSKYSKLKKLKKIKQEHLPQENLQTFIPLPTEYAASKDDYLKSKVKNWKSVFDTVRLSGIGNLQDQKIRKQQTEDNSKKNETKFLQIDDENVDYDEVTGEPLHNFAEAIICLWQVTQQGQLRKLKQTTFDYDQCYSPTKKNNMRLTLSHDQHFVSLNLIKDNQVTLMAWSTKDLKPREITPEVQSQLTFSGHLEELCLIGDSQYILITDKKALSIHYRIIGIESGQVLFNFENKMGAMQSTDNEEMQLHCLGLLFHRQIEQNELEKDISDDEDEMEEEILDDQSIPEDDYEHISEHSDEEHNLINRVLSEMKESSAPHIQGALNDSRDDAVEEQSQEESEEQDKQLEGGDEDEYLNLRMSAFFFNLKLHKSQDAIDNKKEEHAYVIKIDVDLLTTKLGEDVEEQLHQMAQEKCKELEHGHQQKAFLLPKYWFMSKKKKLEPYLNNITIGTNKRFNYFGFLNSAKKQYFAFSMSHQHKIVKELDTHKYSLNKMTPSHARNQYTKNNVFLQLDDDKQHWTYVFFDANFQSKINTGALVEDMQQHYELDDKEITKPVQKLMLHLPSKLAGAYSDSLFFQKNKIIQAITLNTQNEVQLKTQAKKIDSHGNISQKKIDELRASKNQRVQTSFPIIAYNVGMNKIIFQLTVNSKRAVVYELQASERFIDFLDYTSLDDLNFNPKTTIFDACSSFVFLTEQKNEKGIKKPIVNIMLIDPYLKQEAFVHFRSSKNFDRSIYSEPDEIKHCIIYSTKGSDGVQNQTIRILLQYHDKIQFIQMDDVDNNEQDNDDISESSSSSQDESDDIDDDEKLNMRYEPVKALINKRGDIYYVTNYEGQCTIWEINGSSSDNIPQKIYEIRSSKCLGFSFHNDFFYFIDDGKIINKLLQNIETRQLTNIEDLYIKDKDKPYFEYSHFSTVTIMDNQFIYRSGIYHLYKDQPLEDGILDMEELLQTSLNESSGYHDYKYQKKLVHNARQIRGSNLFTLFYRVENNYQYHFKIYQIPDSMQITLLQDSQKAADMSTFLNDGSILLKIDQRFMHFTQNGKFISEVDFQQDQEDWQKRVKSMIANVAMNVKRLNPNNRQSQMMTKQKSFSSLSTVNPVDILTKFVKATNLNLKMNSQPSSHMKLLKMSEDNQYFLFSDSYNKTLYVYTLEVSNNTNSYLEFMRVYEVPWRSSKAITEDFEFFNQKDKNADPVKLTQFDDLCTAIEQYEVECSIDNKGNVVLTHCFEPVQYEQENVTLMHVVGSKFSNGQPEPQNFKQSVEFQLLPIEDVDDIINDQLKLWKNVLAVELDQQSRLPDNYKNPANTIKIKEQLEKLEVRKQLRYSAQIIGKYLVFQCGRFIQVADFEQYEGNSKILYQKDFGSPGHKSPMDFKLLNMNFANHIEIMKILSIEFKTSFKQYKDESQQVESDDLIQIVAKDNQDNNLIITTWNCQDNAEYAMYQSQCTVDQSPENFVVRGLNKKLNYFYDQHQIFDLEYEIPFQRVVDNDLIGTGVGYEFYNQRKIYWDNSRSLCLNNFATLYFPLTRRDLTFWKNVGDKDDNPTTIIENTEFSQFSQVFGHHSLFHHFAKNYDMIKLLHAKYILIRDDEETTKLDLNVPLMLLNPDNNGNTALDIAINADKPQCFELMLDMLEDFRHCCLSKMMLSVFPHMLMSHSEICYKFFHTASYEPYSMTSDFKIPWPNELNEVIFTSHTILISEHKLLMEIGNTLRGLSYTGINKFFNQTTQWLNQTGTSKIFKKSKRDDNYNKVLETENEEEDDDMQAAKNVVDVMKEKVKNKNQVMRAQILDEEVSEKKEAKATVKRIQMQCLDFDWIFNTYIDQDGDQKCNALALLRLLGDNGHNSKLYKQNSIRVFLTMLWNKYQPLIIFYKLVPFVIALVAQNIVTLLGADILEKIVKGTLEDKKLIQEMVALNVLYAGVIVIELYWFYNTYGEIKEWCRDGLDYLRDPWNYLDLGITFLTQIYMYAFIMDLVFQEKIFSVSKVRTLGGLVVFLLWIKMFYWLRLFTQTAYFIKLIMRTIYDLRHFLVLILIIMSSFVTMFYVFQQNIKAQTFYDDNGNQIEKRYIDEYTGHELIDSFIAIYLITVGDFYTENYKESPNNIIIWPMFLLCNFLMAIVFMNMLIAIMGQTFGEIQAVKIESDLEQKIELMKDYEDLFKMEKYFKGKKYIIHAKPVLTSAFDEVPDVVEAIDQSSIELIKQFNKRLDEAERQNVSMIKQQNVKIFQIQKTLNTFYSKVTQNSTRDAQAQNYDKK